MNAGRLRLAELTSSLGAGILGAGIGIFLENWLRETALALLAIGLVMHAWGMADKERIERGLRRPAWSALLYWTCWLALGGLGLYVVARVLVG